MALPAPLPVDLSAPDGRGPERTHDPTFGAWDRGLSALRDTINLGIRVLNEVGAGLRELPGGSLDDLLARSGGGRLPRASQRARARRARAR
jgi:hypothetical protein